MTGNLKNVLKYLEAEIFELLDDADFQSDMETLIEGLAEFRSEYKEIASGIGIIMAYLHLRKVKQNA